MGSPGRPPGCLCYVRVVQVRVRFQVEPNYRGWRLDAYLAKPFRPRDLLVKLPQLASSS